MTQKEPKQAKMSQNNIQNDPKQTKLIQNDPKRAKTTH